jgi:hypothetical protein
VELIAATIPGRRRPLNILLTIGRDDIHAMCSALSNS